MQTERRSERMRSAAALTALLIVAHAGAAELQLLEDAACTTIRLDKSPYPSSRVPVQDQGGTQLCSAYAAAQLADSWRLRKDPTALLSSPISIALENASVGGANRINDLPVLDLMRRINELRPCNYNEVGDTFGTDGPADFIFKLIQIYRSANESQQMYPKVASALDTLLQSAGLRRPDRMISLLQLPNWVAFVSSAVNGSCQKTIDMKSLPPVTFYKSSMAPSRSEAMKTMRDMINVHLERQSQPVGISYCKSVLLDRDSGGVSESGILNTSTCSGQVHASVVLGRRLARYVKDDGKEATICQFLVRDSYGGSCGKYGDDPRTTPNQTCERGQVWVDENALMQNTSEVFLLRE